MNYKVIGWTYYNDEHYPLHGEASESAYRAIVAEVRKKGYRFGGDSHLFRRGCTPVLNDGTRVCFSQRAWGALMAEAWEIDDTDGYAYMVWYMEGRYDEAKNPVRPRPGVRRKFILSPEALVSVHEMHLDDEPFFAIRNGSKTVEIRLCDEKRKVIDDGDVIVFERGNTGEKVVTRVTQQWVCDTFLTAYEAFPPMRFGAADDVTPKELAERILRYYTGEEEKKYGVLAIELTLVAGGDYEKFRRAKEGKPLQ